MKSACSAKIFDCRYPSLEAMGGGIDHKFILSDLSANLKDAGTLYSPESGIEMQCTTTMPCIMIYTGNMVDIDGKNHFHYGKHAGVCFETMLFSSLRDMYGFVAVIEPGKEHRSCRALRSLCGKRSGIMLEQLKEQVCAANKMLPQYGLVSLHVGNVSG